MTFDEEAESYDPVIAEKFEMIHRLPVPKVEELYRQPAEPLPRIVPQPTYERRLYVMAAAAAVVVIAGISFLALGGLGSNPNVAATDGDRAEHDDGDGNDENGLAPDRDQSGEDNGSLTVEVPSPDSADGSGNVDGSAVATTTTVESGEPTESEGGTVVPPQAGGPTTTGGETDQTTTVTGTPATTTPETTTSQPTTTTPPEDSTTLFSFRVTEERTTTIRGIVTEVFTDCQSRLILTEDDEVESVGPVSCDGGSYIIVNNNRIQTSSGYVAENDAYDRHMKTLQPGQSVVVKAMPQGRGLLTLSCVQCGISIDS